jgi:colanic acid/amylovoran biosynthesis glycosyltransferase
MMKIAFLVPQFPKLSETFILNQITGLLDLGCDVQIFAQYHPEEFSCHSDVKKYRLMEKVTYLDYPENRFARTFSALHLLGRYGFKSPLCLLSSLNPFKFGKKAMSLKMLHWVTPFLEGYDIIQCHFGYSGILGAHLKEAGIKGKLVTMFHGHDIRLGLEKGGHIYFDLFKHGDCFLSISDYNYENLVKFGADPKKIIHHSVGIDLDLFSPDEKKVENKDGEIVLLTVARLVPVKGLEYGIKAVYEVLRKYPDSSLKYHILGSGPQEAFLKKLTKDYDITEAVIFLGSKGQDQVVEEMNCADIFFLPSVSEALPVCLMEAQAMKLPVIATDVGSVSEVVVNGKSGFLVPERDVEALANKLEYLVEHPEIWPEMGKTGRDYVKKHYDIHRLNDRLFEIFQSLMVEDDEH